MTLQEIVVQVFEALGEPSDLNPYDTDGTTILTTSSGWTKLVDAINTGCLALSAWKWPSGRQIRMRLTEDTTVFEVNQSTKVVAGGGWSSPTLTVTVADSTANLQVGKLAVGGTSGASGYVLYSSGVTLYLTKVSGTFLPGETVTLYQREFVFVSGTDPRSAVGIPYTPANGVPLDIVGLHDIGNGTPLEETSKRERWLSPDSTVGTPTAFYRVPKGVVFDTWPTDGLTYVVRYQRGPKTLGYTITTEEPELPAQFHYGLVLFGTWWGLRRAQESNDAYAVKKDLEEFMLRTRTENDFQDDLVSGQVKLYPDGL